MATTPTPTPLEQLAAVPFTTLFEQLSSVLCAKALVAAAELNPTSALLEVIREFAHAASPNAALVTEALKAAYGGITPPPPCAHCESPLLFRQGVGWFHAEPTSCSRPELRFPR